MKPYVITIARQYGSGGKTVGKMLARKLGIPFYNREIITMASEDSGVNAMLFSDERLKGDFLTRLRAHYHGNAPVPNDSSKSYLKDEALFAYHPTWKTTTLTQLCKGLYILLGTILLVIPGLIMGYTYAMTDYILAEHPDMAPGEVMMGSKAMMEGNRWRLFCLQFSFIGWMILSSLTFGLGNLALRPYQEASYAAFYREVSLG